jgi:hypothetical protein
MTVNSPVSEPAASSAPRGLVAFRAELRCILEHPAISPERRQAAELFITQCTESTRLESWLALAVAECGRWEEQTLASETQESYRRLKN